MTVKTAQGDNPAMVAPTGLEFQITDTHCTFQLLFCQKEMTKTFRTIKVRV